MPNPTFLYHRTNPRGQLYPDLTADLERTLADEGWVDSPDKLEERFTRDPEVKHPLEIQSGKAIPRETPVNLTTGSGTEIGKQPINTGPVSILASDEAKARFGKLWDPDGVPLYGALKLEELGRIIDAMSVDEIKQALEFAGLGDNALDPEEWTSMLRGRLAQAIRPEMPTERAPSEVELGDNVSNVDEAVARAKAKPGETIPPTPTDSRPAEAGNQGGEGGSAGTDTIAEEDMVETYGTKTAPADTTKDDDTENGSSASDPTRSNTGNETGETVSTTGDSTDTRAVDTATPERRDELREEVVIAGGEAKVEQVDAMTEEQREQWLTHKDTDKAHLRAILEAKGKTPKARDGKEEMQEAVRLLYAGA